MIFACELLCAGHTAVRADEWNHNMFAKEIRFKPLLFRYTARCEYCVNDPRLGASSYALACNVLIVELETEEVNQDG